MASSRSPVVGAPWGAGNGGGATASPLAFDATTHQPISAQLTRAIQVYPPQLYPIPGAQNFNPEAHAASVGPEVGTVLTACNFLVPANSTAVIRSFTTYIDNMLLTTNVTWSLLVNGAAPSGFGNVTMFPRVAPFVSNTFDCLILVSSGSGTKLSVAFSNIDGGTYEIGAAFSGWYWSDTDGQRWLSGQSI